MDAIGKSPKLPTREQWVLRLLNNVCVPGDRHEILKFPTIIEFSLNVLTEFSNVFSKIKRIAVLEPWVLAWETDMIPQRHKDIGYRVDHQIDPHLCFSVFISFSEFVEFSENRVHLGKTLMRRRARHKQIQLNVTYHFTKSDNHWYV